MVINLATRLLSIIILTFVIAIIYGIFVTTMDFMQPNYDPVASGHRAAGNIYGLFGTVDSEIKANDQNVHGTSVAHRIAMPYALTADLSAILSGKIEAGASAMYHRAEQTNKS